MHINFRASHSIQVFPHRTFEVEDSDEHLVLPKRLVRLKMVRKRGLVL